MVVVSNNLIQVKLFIGTNYNLFKDNKVFTKFVEYGIITYELRPEELPKTDRWFALLSRGRMFLPS